MLNNGKGFTKKKKNHHQLHIYEENHTKTVTGIKTK